MEPKTPFFARAGETIKNNKLISIIFTLIIFFIFYEIYEIIILGLDEWMLINGFSQIWEIKVDPITNIPIEKQIHYRTLWDVLELVIIPVVLALGALFYNKSEREQDKELAVDQQREMELQNYFNRMTNLLLKKGLRDSLPGDEIRTVARTLTLTTLLSLDGTRKGFLIKFLYEAELIIGKNPIISLQNAVINNIDLNTTILNKINLINTSLQNANLNSTFFNKAHLEGAHFEGANLELADLYKAKLRWAFFKRANLNGANFEKSDLFGADLIDAILLDSNFKNANLKCPSYFDIQVTPEQLSKVESLEGATMPDGRIYDPSIPLEEFCIKPNP